MDSNYKVATIRIVMISMMSFFFQCKEEKVDFYKDNMAAHDVWRLPIVKPYHLITADCCRDWGFKHKDIDTFFSVDSINYIEDYILVHTQDSDFDWGVIDLKSRKVIRFIDRKDYEEFLMEKDLSDKLYFVDKVYKCWQETGQLPWGAEILKLQDCY